MFCCSLKEAKKWTKKLSHLASGHVNCGARCTKTKLSKYGKSEITTHNRTDSFRLSRRSTTTAMSRTARAAVQPNYLGNPPLFVSWIAPKTELGSCKAWPARVRIGGFYAALGCQFCSILHRQHVGMLHIYKLNLNASNKTSCLWRKKSICWHSRGTGKW